MHSKKSKAENALSLSNTIFPYAKVTFQSPPNTTGLVSVALLLQKEGLTTIKTAEIKEAVKAYCEAKNLRYQDEWPIDATWIETASEAAKHLRLGFKKVVIAQPPSGGIFIEQPKEK